MVHNASCFLASLIFLSLLPSLAAAKRTPWDKGQVSELASRLVDQSHELGEALQRTSEQAEAATADPDREVGIGNRTVVIHDLAILESRAKKYVEAVEAGLGREETRSLFGRIEALMNLTQGDVRSLPDYTSYRADLDALEKTVTTLAGFYAEELEVRTPPDPLKQGAR